MVSHGRGTDTWDASGISPWPCTKTKDKEVLDDVMDLKQQTDHISTTLFDHGEKMVAMVNLLEDIKLAVNTYIPSSGLPSETGSDISSLPMDKMDPPGKIEGGLEVGDNGKADSVGTHSLRSVRAIRKDVEIGSDVEEQVDKTIIKVNIVLPPKLLEGANVKKAYVQPQPVPIHGDGESSLTVRSPQSESSTPSETIMTLGGGFVAKQELILAEMTAPPNGSVHNIESDAGDWEDEVMEDDDADMGTCLECAHQRIEDDNGDDDFQSAIDADDNYQMELCAINELNVLSVDEPNLPGKGWVRLDEDITLDSGASHSVSNGARFTPEWSLEPSEASRKGVKYVWPG